MSSEKQDDEDEKNVEVGMKDEDKKKALDFIHAELDDIECFHGIMLEEDLKGILCRDGDFVLRMRHEPSGAKEVLLSAKWKGEYVDVKLKAKQSNDNPDHPKFMFQFDKNTKHKTTTIAELIKKHLMGIPISLGEKKNGLMLLNPIAKQSWELKPGSLELQKKLGEGAFGEVRCGKLKTRDGVQTKFINVAVKVIKRCANNEKATMELQKEGSLMRKFKHENVVRVYGTIFERDTVMVVMELVTGGGLNDYVRKNKVSNEEKGSYAVDIATGLMYIHSLNCIHRDIACRNCLVDVQSKVAKVSDFGLTRQTEKHKITPDERIPIRWIAPEVLKTFEYTRAADIYAYGILVWEIFANGAMPFDNMTNGQIKEGIQTPSFRPQFPADTPSEIIRIVDSCWCGEPENRMQMSKVRKELSKYKKAAFGGSDRERGGTHAEPSSNPQEGTPVAPAAAAPARAAKAGGAKSNESKKSRSKKPKSRDTGKSGKSIKKQIEKKGPSTA